MPPVSVQFWLSWSKNTNVADCHHGGCGTQCFAVNLSHDVSYVAITIYHCPRRAIILHIGHLCENGHSARLLRSRWENVLHQLYCAYLRKTFMIQGVLTTFNKTLQQHRDFKKISASTWKRTFTLAYQPPTIRVLTGKANSQNYVSN